MPSLNQFLKEFKDSGQLAAVASNNVAQFGTTSQPYLGATLLPDRTVPQNSFREGGIRYRSVIANQSARYSPVQIKDGGQMVGSFLVELADSDIGREFTSQDYDALVDILRTTGSMEAAASRLGAWSDAVLLGALLDFCEKQRWEAIVDGTVVGKGDNGFDLVVEYRKPAGHRVAAGGQWSDDAYDPYDDIMAGAELLRSKGYEPTRVFGSSLVESKLYNNANIRKRGGRVMVVGTEQLLQGGQVAALTNVLSQEGLPSLTRYDRRYWNEDGTQGRFLKQDVLVMVGTTGRSEQVVSTLDPEDIRIMENTLGYNAVGRAPGEQSPGRVINVEAKSNKPPRLEGEAFQTTMPVITDEEAIFVVTGIS